MSVLRYVAAILNILGVRWFVLGTCAFGNKYLVEVDFCQIPTARIEWNCRWIHFEGWVAVWLRIYDRETDLPLSCKEEENDYAFCLTRYLLGLRHSDLNGKSLPTTSLFFHC